MEDELSVQLIYQNGARQKRQSEKAEKENAEDFWVVCSALEKED